MASLSIQVISGLGTNTTILNFVAGDASRYFNAWKNKAGPKDSAGVPIGTQANFVVWLAQNALSSINHLVTTNEQTAVVPPVVTVGSS